MRIMVRDFLLAVDVSMLYKKLAARPWMPWMSSQIILRCFDEKMLVLIA
jgi:hypothetical protein